MIVVSDTSPLFALVTLKRVELLKTLYGRVIMPPAVLTELLKLAPDKTNLITQEVAWLQVIVPADENVVQIMRNSLDPGEAATLVLALEYHADYLLIDELRGREEARKLSIKVKGVLAVLLEGKSKGFVDKIVPLMDQLIKQIDFRISKKLYTQIAQ